MVHEFEIVCTVYGHKMYWDFYADKWCIVSTGFGPGLRTRSADAKRADTTFEELVKRPRVPQSTVTLNRYTVYRDHEGKRDEDFEPTIIKHYDAIFDDVSLLELVA